MNWRGLGTLACVTLLAGLLFAEPDGAIAHPLRWCDPNGTPAGTRRSACLPLTNDVAEAWHVELPGLVEAPLVYWGREAYLICGKGNVRSLVAVDVLAGTVIARKRLPEGPRPLPVVWDGRVYLRTSPTELSEYRRAGGSFNRLWTHKVAQSFLSDPIVFENEIYAIADGDLVRLRPRRSAPLWSTGHGSFRGRPALYGPHVYVVGEFESDPEFAPSMHLYVFNRSDGEGVLTENAAWYTRGDMPGLEVPAQITVTEREVLIRGPRSFRTQRGAASHVMLDRSGADGALRIGQRAARLQNFAVAPAMTGMGTLGLVKSQPVGWVVGTAERGLYLSQFDDNPDLYSDLHRVGPTVLGDVVYFGAWAADIRTRRILWRLPVQQLRFPAVPVDGGVLIVDDMVNLRCFRARRRRG